MRSFRAIAQTRGIQSRTIAAKMQIAQEHKHLVATGLRVLRFLRVNRRVISLRLERGQSSGVVMYLHGSRRDLGVRSA